MSSAALAARENWQAEAGKGGAAHEVDVSKVFTELFKMSGYTDYEFNDKPTVLNQIFLELDYKKNPTKYVKGSAPSEGQVFYDEGKKDFFTWSKGGPKRKKHGMIPDGQIRNKLTGKSVLIEDKKQNDAGNAHERACKYGVPKIQKAIQEKLGVTGPPVVWIFAGACTTSDKYILEFAACFEEDLYVLVKPTDNSHEILKAWFDANIKNILA